MKLISTLVVLALCGCQPMTPEQRAQQQIFLWNMQQLSMQQQEQRTENFRLLLRSQQRQPTQSFCSQVGNMTNCVSD